MPTAIIKGITTIVWGTSNTLNAPAGAIVDSIRITPKNGAPIEIEDNAGFAAIAVLLDDGFDAAMTCVYDMNKAWPNIGDNLKLALPGWTGSNNATTNYNGFVGATPEVDMARKREATIAYKFIYRPGITP
jgi:hypothetical protein